MVIIGKRCKHDLSFILLNKVYEQFTLHHCSGPGNRMAAHHKDKLIRVTKKEAEMNALEFDRVTTE
jgi:hypothetical protein